MQKIIFLSSFIFTINLFSMPPLNEIMMAEKKIEQNSPTYSCLKKGSFKDCKMLVFKMDKPVFFNKLRDIAINSNDIKILKEYLKITKNRHLQRSFNYHSYEKEAIVKLQKSYRWHGKKSKKADLFQKSYKLSKNTYDADEFCRYASVEEMLKNSTFLSSMPSRNYYKRCIDKLHSIATKKAYYTAYKINRSDKDLLSATALIDNKNRELNEKILDTYFNKHVSSLQEFKKFTNYLKRCNTCEQQRYFLKMVSVLKSIKDVPLFVSLLKEMKQCNINQIKQQIAQKEFFGKNLTITNFFNSIEYRYILKDIGYKLKLGDIGRRYSIKLIPNAHNAQTIYFSFDAKCSYSRTITRRESMGFFESLGSNATEKDVTYEISLCKPIQKKNQNKIYNLYLKSNQLQAYNDIKKQSWELRKAISQRVVRNTAVASSGKVSVCIPSIPRPIDYSKCDGAKTASGKYATVQLSRSGGGLLSSSNCFDLKIYAGGSIAVGNTCGGVNGSWSVIVNGQSGFANGLTNAIVWLLKRM